MKARRVPNAFDSCLARNRRSPKRPSEARLSGVHPEDAQWNKGAEPPRFRLKGGDALYPRSKATASPPRTPQTLRQDSKSMIAGSFGVWLCRGAARMRLAPFL